MSVLHGHAPNPLLWRTWGRSGRFSGAHVSACSLPNTACETNIKEGTAFAWPKAFLLRALQINASLIFRALQGKAPHTLLKAPGPWKGWVYPPLLFPSLTPPPWELFAPMYEFPRIWWSQGRKSHFSPPPRGCGLMRLTLLWGGGFWFLGF